MNEGHRKAVETLALTDAQFFALDDAGVFALQSKLAAAIPRPAKKPPPGASVDPLEFLVIGAPRSADMAGVPDVPILVASRQTDVRRWEVDPAQNMRLVAVDLTSGAVRTANPYASGKREETPAPSMSGPRPEGSRAAATITSVSKVALGNALETPLHDTRMALTLVNFDRRSNTVIVDLKGTAGGRSAAPPRPPSRFVAVVQDPARMPAPGTFLFDVAPQGAGDATILFRAGLNLPLAEIVTADAAGSPGGRVLLMTLLLLGRDHPVPIVVEVAVPAQAGGPTQANAWALFRFDVEAALGARVPGGTYQVYLVAGSRISDPRTLTLAR